MHVLLLLQQGGGGVIPPSESGAEETIRNLVLWLRLIIEALGAAVIGVGILVAIYVVIRSLRSPKQQAYSEIRLTFARFLALALEFQVAADILSTAVAPSWDQIGKLAAIAIIRTALNYFLTQEIKEERAAITETRVTNRQTQQVEGSFGDKARKAAQENE